MRVQLKGIHKVRKKLADGSYATYFYAWRGGPRLLDGPGSPSFIADFASAQAKRKLPASGLMFSLISEYRASADYRGLGKETEKAYRRYLAIIEKEFGDMPIAALSDKRVRGQFKLWRDGMAATPRKADLAWTILARVMSFAKDRGRIDTNPCERGGRLHRGSRADIIWNDEDIELFLKAAPSHLKLAFTLALWTGWRQGVLLDLVWSGYDGKTIRTTNNKPSKGVATKLMVPAVSPLKAILATTDRKALHVLTNSNGEPWSKDGFRTSFRKFCAKIGIRDRTFHDLRGTAVTKLARAGATVAEIASVTGHSLKDVATILDGHYLGDRAGLATSGIKKLERKQKRTKTVN